MAKSPRILLIYTGGTIGMIRDPKSGQLKPFNFTRLLDEVPELSKFDVKISTHSFRTPIDSSDMQPEIWMELAHLIESEYNNYDGFVILHGSDTMAFTASALSFMFENLSKPVVLTGSQLPIGTIRTDGKENLITAIEIAAATHKGKAIVPEVCVYFEYRLYRGNRTNKFNAEHFRAFHSPNYPLLAEAGIHIHYNHSHIAKAGKGKLKILPLLDKNIAILKMFPGITPQVVNAILSAENLKAVILETYGSGNVTTEKWFTEAVKAAIKKGVVILNITQCAAGTVEQGRYQTSAQLEKAGVVGGADMTTEAAVTKLMHLLAYCETTADLTRKLKKNLRGELTEF